MRSTSSRTGWRGSISARTAPRSVATIGVVLAVPPLAAAGLVPDLRTPSEFRAIVNAHFRLEPPAGLAPITGVLNGTIEWLFAFPDRLSITISAADRLLDVPRETLAAKIWDEVATVAGLPGRCRRGRSCASDARPLPQRRARTPSAPSAKTAWRNLLLAGDWTRTGLPATIEGAIRSGNRAAELADRLIAKVADFSNKIM